MFAGHDWAEDHHDIHIEDNQGHKLRTCRLEDGVARLRGMFAEVVDDPAEGLIATETDRGLYSAAMTAAGYSVMRYPRPSIGNATRHRQPSQTGPTHRSWHRSFASTAHNHRPLEPDSALADAIKETSRAHQNLIWTRQRQLNRHGSLRRWFFPAAVSIFPELAHSDCLATLAVAPTPEAGRRITAA